MTRVLQLKNIKTGTIEECFDDSALKSNENFEFMKIGSTYDCKIELFGNFVEKETPSSVSINIEEELFIGKKMMIRVKLDNEFYYIPKKNEKDISVNAIMNFEFTRKDLIQVEDVIHGDYI